MQMPADCMLCVVTRELDTLQQERDLARKTDYVRELFRLVAELAPGMSTPQVCDAVDALHERWYGAAMRRDYAAVKHADNALMLSLEEALRADILAAEDPLACALRLARASNYIDYGTGQSVSRDKLLELLREAKHDALDADELASLRADLARARTGLYITDNCGEIVADKLLLERLQAEFPAVRWTALVRGTPAINDATVDDAAFVGLDRLAPVVGNGTRYPGTVRGELSPEAEALLTGADVLIAKGQANFETLHGSGLNLYYLLLCKCEFFVRRFGVMRLAPMFVNERRVELPQVFA